MHVHLFFNGRLIFPRCKPGCRKCGETRFVHCGRWFDLAVFGRATYHTASAIEKILGA